MDSQGSQRAIILHGFDNREISIVMKAVKGALSADIIFARSTPISLQMRLDALIEDISKDHRYIKEHPPKRT